MRTEDLAPLARLGLWALSHLRGVYAGDIDAGDLQDKAAALGVIERVPAPKPCGEHCVCAEADADYCYIDTPATVAARKGLAEPAAVEEPSHATEVAQLRNLLADGDCAHDVATLRNVQEQRRKVVDEAIKWVDSPESDYDGGWGPLLAAVAEYKRITGRTDGDGVRVAEVQG